MKETWRLGCFGFCYVGAPALHAACERACPSGRACSHHCAFDGILSRLTGPRERSPSRKNVAVGQPQLGAAIRVSVSESAMGTPRHRGPAFVITRASQPGKFMSYPISNSYAHVHCVSPPGCLLYPTLSLCPSDPVDIRRERCYNCWIIAWLSSLGPLHLSEKIFRLLLKISVQRITLWVYTHFLKSPRKSGIKIWERWRME